MIIRAETPADAVAIRAVHDAAFGGPAEGVLVDALRAAGDLALSLVAEDEAAVIGHIALSPINGAVAALALAPLAVVPARQGQGIGSKLVFEALERARHGSWAGVFVLGDPAYYRRFGFTAEAAAPFDSPYAGPNFMARPIGHEALAGKAGPIRHAPAFASST